MRALKASRAGVGMSGTLAPMSTGRYLSKFQNLGYRWVQCTEKISEFGYCCEPDTEEISEVGYRWVLGTEEISEVGYRVPRKFQKMGIQA